MQTVRLSDLSGVGPYIPRLRNGSCYASVPGAARSPTSPRRIADKAAQTWLKRRTASSFPALVRVAAALCMVAELWWSEQASKRLGASETLKSDLSRAFASKKGFE